MISFIKAVSFAALITSVIALSACNSGDSSADLGLSSGNGNSSAGQSILPAGVFTGGVGLREYLAINLNNTSHSFFWFYTPDNVTLAASTQLDGFLTGFLTSSGSFDSGTISSNNIFNFNLANADINNSVSLNGGYSSSGLSATVTGLSSSPQSFSFNAVDLSGPLNNQRSFTGTLVDESGQTTTSVLVQLSGLNNTNNGALISDSSSSCTLQNGALKPTDLTHVYLASFVTGNCFTDSSTQHNGVAVIYNGRLFLSLSNSNQATGIVFVSN